MNIPSKIKNSNFNTGLENMIKLVRIETNFNADLKNMIKLVRIETRSQ